MGGGGENLSNSDREFPRTKARIEAAAALWEQENRDPSRLLAEGRPLAEGAEILARRREDVSPDLIDFIQASAAQARRGRRHKRSVTTGKPTVREASFQPDRRIGTHAMET